MTNEALERVTRIEKVFPHGVENLQVCDNGEDFLVIEVNHEWMFRFVRSRMSSKALAREKRFLPIFAQLSPVSIPQIEYSGDDFIGYRKIKGVQLTPQIFNTLDQNSKKRIAGQLGRFLSKLHGFPLEQAVEMGLTEGWGGWREKAFRRFNKQIVPLLSSTAQDQTMAFFERFFAMKWKRVVTHGDFYPPDHVFIDEGLGHISGVIDFGDLTIEDAAADFQSILEDFGDTFFRNVTANYAYEVNASFLDRIKKRIKARPLFDAVYALEYGFTERFRRRLAEIETEFGKETHARLAAAP